MKKNLILLHLLFFAFIFTSCEEKDENLTPEESNKHVNNWIYERMNVYYLWNDKLPASPNFSLSPDKFFESICYRYNENSNPDGDRFSWIQDNYVDLVNELSGVSNDEIGFDFMLYRMSENSNDLCGEVWFVKKGTPAEAMGLKRGQFFTEINNQQLTIDNWENILKNLKGNYTLSVHTDDGQSLSPKQLLSLSTVSKYEDNPIYYSNVYTINNKKIGYLVYNFFVNDNGDGSCKYDAQLAQIFSNFKSQNISSLILDLRYNSGGQMTAATALASMIVKNFSTQNLFAREKWNDDIEPILKKDYGAEFFNTYFIDKISPNEDWNKLTTAIPLPNIGNNLQEFYVLTGEYTASASEMIINGLKPYMTVTLLGETTMGKNVGSISIYEENNPKNKWGIQPIVFKLYNANGKSDYTAGFTPNFVNYDDVYPKRELGDLEENMLSDAIRHIAGVSTLKVSVLGRKSSYKKIFSSLEKKPWRNQVICKTKSLSLITKSK